MRYRQTKRTVTNIKNRPKRSQDTKCGFHITNSRRDLLLLQVPYPKRTKFRKYEKGKWKGRKKRLSYMSRFSHMSLKKVIWVSNKNIRDQKLRKLAAKYELKRMPYKAIR